MCILGSTGSIGTQALEVIEANPDKFKVVALSANRNVELLAEQIKKFQVPYAVIGDKSKYKELSDLLKIFPVKILTGEKGLEEIAALDEVDMMLSAVVGFSGLIPTMKAIEAGKDIALANKETLVVAGELVMKAAKDNGVNIYPVDSEHSAIFQCLQGEERDQLEKIILTASGGPFRGKNRFELENIKKEEALKHPNWEMGAKITIDSATLMNKGLEVIEAKWLFDLEVDDIDVIVHPQSIIHSMVQFRDSSILAQMGLPDMKLPIQYALTYPDRMETDFKRFDFMAYPELTFEKPDIGTFRNLGFAYRALEEGGCSACVLNAANEVAVDAFLRDKVSFLGMSDMIEKSMNYMNHVSDCSLEDYKQIDSDTRDFTRSLLL